MTTENLTINEALKNLIPSDQSIIENDIMDAEIRLKKTKKSIPLEKLVAKIKAKKMNLAVEENRKEFDREICLSLKKIKEDFIPLFQIYNILTNKEKYEVLKKYLIIKRDGEDDTSINEISEVPLTPVITINLEIIDNDKKYYSNIVNGVLNMMTSNFEDTFLKHHFNFRFLCEYNRDIYYGKNAKELKVSLDKVIEDVNRIIASDKSDKNKHKLIDKQSQTEKIIEKKMPKNDFINILERSNLENDDILLKIYAEAESNEQIIKKIKNSSIKKYDKTIIFNIKDYLKFDELSKKINAQDVQIDAQNKQIKNLKDEKAAQDGKIDAQKNQIDAQNKQIDAQNKQIDAQNKQIKNLNGEIEKLNDEKNKQDNKIKSLNAQIENLNTDKKTQEENINQLNKKVGYMEIIMNALISRKVIKHCIIKILSKYKNSLEIVKRVIDKNGKKIESSYIRVKKNINDVSVENSQKLIDLLFEKKDLYNECVHFDGIEKPSFVDNVWDIVINFTKLTEDEKVIFNKIITDDIKNSFQFSQKDIKIEI